MGVALFLLPLMLIVLLGPLIYLIVAGKVLKRASRGAKHPKRTAFLVLAIFLAYPAFEGVRLLRLHQLCQIEQPWDTSEVTGLRQPILLLQESNRAGMPIWVSLNHLISHNPNVYTASIIDGVASTIHECRDAPESCPITDPLDFAYWVRWTLPHRQPVSAWFDPDVSLVQVVEPRSGRILRERRDYVVRGFAGIYHGLLNGHPGQLGCGHAGSSIGAWRPKNVSPQTEQYGQADYWFVASAFPWLPQ